MVRVWFLYFVARRLPAFAVSGILHLVFFILLASWSVALPANQNVVSRRSYHVRFIRLAPLTYYPQRGSRPLPNEKKSNNSSSTRPAAGDNRQFELPDIIPLQTAHQTLVQLDVPPDVSLKHEITVPQIVSWTQPSPSEHPLKPVMTPPVEEDNVANLPAIPILSLPNAEAGVTDLKLSTPALNELPKLPRPNARTFPIASLPMEQASRLPQISPSSDPSQVHVISLPDIALLPQTLIVVPPANQVAPAGGSKGSGTESQAVDGTGTVAGMPAALPGMTLIARPKDGKFQVVVLGSGTSAPHLEAAAALSGKIVYTVYVPVGLRKSWILQYCLPKGSDAGPAGLLQAPWPFYLVLPDQFARQGPDYVIVHGLITAEGRFDGISVVFPDDFNESETILGALRLWHFRSASRGGEPSAVEVLLIIPVQ